MSSKIVKDVSPNETLHIDVYCPKCGTEMTELDFEKSKDGFAWKSYRKCPKCGSKIEWLS